MKHIRRKFNENEHYRQKVVQAAFETAKQQALQQMR